MATTPSFVQITEGAGKRLAAATYTENSQVVFDQKMVLGEEYLASYSVTANGVVGAANTHMLQIMAGSSLNVRVRRLRVRQEANSNVAITARFSLIRLSSAGTGGTTVTPAKFDNSDAAAGATAMTLPAAAGTETTVIQNFSLNMRQALSATQSQPDDTWEWTQTEGMKPLIIPAGVANGIVLKWGTNSSTLHSINVYAEIVETSF